MPRLSGLRYKPDPVVLACCLNDTTASTDLLDAPPAEADREGRVALRRLADPPARGAFAPLLLVVALLAGSGLSAGCGPPPAERYDPAAGGGREGEPMSGEAAPDEAAPDGDPEAAALRAKGTPGRWRRFRTHRFDPRLTEEQRRGIAELESLGYAGASRQRATPGGVVRLDLARVSPGLGFYTSGHGPEAILIDIEGRIVHRWGRAYRDVWPDDPVAVGHSGAEHWRRAHLFENGDVLAIFEGLGIIKLDRASNLIWANPARTHHDLHVMPDGDIYVLAHEAHVVPWVSTAFPIQEDFILVLDAGGIEKRRISILECFERSRFGDLLQRTRRAGDMFHTNTLSVLDGRIADSVPQFQRGRVLVYILKMQTLAVIDLDLEEVVWARREPVWHSHDPKILPNGNLLIFHNVGAERRSRVVEFRSIGPETLWFYEGSAEDPLFSGTCGTAERLPNGNTLIVESDNGRALEVTMDGEIVWEYLNPHRAGDEQDYIATLFDLVRLPSDFPTGWLEEPAAGAQERAAAMRRAPS